MQKKYSLFLFICLAVAKTGLSVSLNKINNNSNAGLCKNAAGIPDSILKKMLKEADLVCKAKLIRVGGYVVWDWGTEEAWHVFEIKECLKGNAKDTISVRHSRFPFKNKPAGIFHFKLNGDYFLFLKEKMQFKSKKNTRSNVTFNTYDHYNTANNDFGIVPYAKILEKRVMELINEKHLQK